nr:SulP family inorganic anion transporter [Corynebacterium sp. HMSC28B08]
MATDRVHPPGGDTVPLGVIPSFRFAFRSPQRLRMEVFGGIAVSLALIPETIAFSVLAGVDPAVGLYTSAIMAIAIAFTGGRPAMITAAAGAVALVSAPLVKAHGVEYLIAAALLAGIIQIILGVAGVAKLMKFITLPVMRGFVNALGILIFTAQLEHVIDKPWIVFVLLAIGIALMLVVPRFLRAIPAPLVVVVLVTIVAVVAGWRVPTVGDMGDLPRALPHVHLPQVPLEWHTFRIIAPYAVAMAIVGLVESLLTAQLVDEITDTPSSKTREACGLGVANIAGGVFGGMGGCAMIGQTMIGVNDSGARTRLSAFVAGLSLLVLLLLFNDAVGAIPMIALVAVMMVVAVRTVNWRSVDPRRVARMPWTETVVMVVTVVPTLLTHNLAVGVVLGSVLAVVFARW